MAGLGAWSPRRIHLPEVIENGCDVILFSTDPVTDAGYIAAALADGRLSAERFETAVLRGLAFKAALGLHRPAVTDRSLARATPQKAAFSESVTRRAPTLVKDVQNLLPIEVSRHRRVLVVTPGIVLPYFAEPVPFALPEMLREHGFEVTLFTPGTAISADRFDLMLYLFGDETLLTRGRIFLDWLKLSGSFMAAMERHWYEIPTAMISFGYPYMLYDAPRVPTYINAYMTTESMQRAVVDALLGNLPWNRNSPIDPFCGLEDARF